MVWLHLAKTQVCWRSFTSRSLCWSLHVLTMLAHLKSALVQRGNYVFHLRRNWGSEKWCHLLRLATRQSGTKPAAFPLYYQPPERLCVSREGLDFWKNDSSKVRCRRKLSPARFYLQLWLLPHLSWFSTLTPPFSFFYSYIVSTSRQRGFQTPGLHKGHSFPWIQPPHPAPISRGWALCQRHKLISVPLLRALRVGVLGKFSSLASVDRWLPGWNSNLCSGLTHMLKWPQMRKSGEGGRESRREGGGKRWVYLTGWTNNVIFFFFAFRRL